MAILVGTFDFYNILCYNIYVFYTIQYRRIKNDLLLWHNNTGKENWRGSRTERWPFGCLLQGRKCSQRGWLSAVCWQLEVQQGRACICLLPVGSSPCYFGVDHWRSFWESFRNRGEKSEEISFRFLIWNPQNPPHSLCGGFLF